jgi:hypothetical protein
MLNSTQANMRANGKDFTSARVRATRRAPLAPRDQRPPWLAAFSLVAGGPNPVEPVANYGVEAAMEGAPGSAKKFEGEMNQLKAVLKHNLGNQAAASECNDKLRQFHARLGSCRKNCSAPCWAAHKP